MNLYLFTDRHGVKIEVYEAVGGYITPGQEALARREKLERKHRKKIIAWCLMGGQ